MNRSAILKLLRNFGSTISNVRMSFSRPYPESLKSLDSAYLLCLEWYLTEYCLESLEVIGLCGLEPNRQLVFETTGVQFPNVKTVSTSHCYFADNFSFSANFPNVQSLLLRNAVCTFNVRDWHFPTVKFLHFDCRRCDSGAKKFRMIDLIEMFKRQPQLEKLELCFTFSDQFHPSLLIHFNEFLPKLQCLSLKFRERIPENFEPAHFEYITDFSLILPTLRLHQQIPFTFNKLESVKISTQSPFFKTIDSAALVSEFIFKNKHLKTINLEGIRGNISELFEFEHILLNVEQLRICAYQNIASNIIERFLMKSRSLKELRICGIDDPTAALNSKISEKIIHRRFDRRNDKVWEFVFRL